MNKSIQLRDPQRRLKLWVARLIQDYADLAGENQQLEHLPCHVCAERERSAAQ